MFKLSLPVLAATIDAVAAGPSWGSSGNGCDDCGFFSEGCECCECDCENCTRDESGDVLEPCEYTDDSVSVRDVALEQLCVAIELCTDDRPGANSRAQAVIAAGLLSRLLALLVDSPQSPHYVMISALQALVNLCSQGKAACASSLLTAGILPRCL